MMVATNPWEFGWAQLLSIAQIILTAAIAIFGFRSFRKWKREKVEERKMEVAVEALAIAYEVDSIFGYIRQPIAVSGEFSNMPQQLKPREGEKDDHNMYKLVLARVIRSQDFFERAFKLQPQFMAVFGPEHGGIFKKLDDARVNVIVAAQTLAEEPRPAHPNEREFWKGLKGDVFASFAKHSKKGDETSRLIEEFKSGIEKICRPLLDSRYRQ